jgi:hypothetical protein
MAAVRLRQRRSLRLTLLGIGAMASPRYRLAGLLLEYDGVRLMLDGGPGAAPNGPLDGWFVTDERCEPMAAIRRLAKPRGLVPIRGRFVLGSFSVTPRSVVHTSHPVCGYLICTPTRRVVWAPEFYQFPRWARGADLRFAEAAGPVRSDLLEAWAAMLQPCGSLSRRAAEGCDSWCSRTSAGRRFGH